MPQLVFKLLLFILCLTENADKGIGQQVAMLVGGVALVYGAASHLHWAENDGVTQQLSAGVGWSAWSS